MSKYLILVIFNLPFVIFGIISAIARYKESSLGRLSLVIRLIFWLTIGIGIVFAQQFYNYLVQNDLTNSQPLSLADVVLVTGINFSLFLTIRSYSRLDHTERKLSDLQEYLSIRLSEDVEERHG
jgi:hypothetical protein